MRASQHAVAPASLHGQSASQRIGPHIALITTAHPHMPPHCLPQIFPGFAGAKVMYGPAGEVHGVQVCT